MGAAVCRAVAEASDLDLVAAVAPSRAGEPVGGVAASSGQQDVADLVLAAGIEALRDASVDVAVDFTNTDAGRRHLRWCADHGVHAVVGTTGFTEDDLADFRQWFGPGQPANAVVAANFSLGAALMMRCAELCAPHFDAVEIVELHHERKRDAPSGTAITTARSIEAARRAASSPPLLRDPTERETLPGARGAVTDGGVRIHAVRLPGLVAHQEVLFGSAGETLTLRHDSTDRVSFMPGVLLAVRRVAERPGLTIGLGPLLGV